MIKMFESNKGLSSYFTHSGLALEVVYVGLLWHTDSQNVSNTETWKLKVCVFSPDWLQ